MDLTNQELRLILVGNMGCGKTLTADTLLGVGSPCSPSVLASSRQCEVRRGEAEGRTLVIVETPRWYWSGPLVEESVRRETERALGLTAPGPHAFLVLVPVGQFTEMERRLPEQLERVFGEGALGHTVVLLTCGDYLLGRDQDQYLRKEEPGLMGMVEQCGGRWHVFNNRQPQDRQQVVSLLEKVEQLAQNKGGCYLQSALQREVDARVREKERELQRRYSLREEDLVEVDYILQMNTAWNGGRSGGSLRGRRRDETDGDKVTLQQLANGLYSQVPESPTGPKQLQRSSSYKLNKEGAILSQMTEKSEVRVSNNGQNFINTIHHHITTVAEPHSSPLPISSSSSGPTSSSSSCSSSSSEIRLVLLGRAGSGKSSAGNAILGREEYKTRQRDVSGLVTHQCTRATSVLGSKRLVVVDTPDWFWSDCSAEEIETHRSSCMELCTPGPHAFLLCVPVTQPAHAILRGLAAIEAAFGPGAVLTRTLVLFTNSDLLKNNGDALGKGAVEEYIASEHPEMLELVEKCGDRYHVLLRGKNGRSVEELLQKVDQAVKESGGGYHKIGSSKEREEEVVVERLEKVDRSISGTLHSLREEDESEEAARQKEEAEKSAKMKESDAPPASSSIFRSILRFTGEKVAAGASRIPKLVAGGALVGGALGLFFGGPLGGAVGATAGTVATEVGRRKYNKRKTD